MGDRYLVELAGWIRAAGCYVTEEAGWQTRARSSGGFDAGRPVCVMWHHTASTASLAGDVDYCATGSPDAPICNLLVARDGTVAVIAAGATNTNGKGGPVTVPPGVGVPVDSMNTYAVGLELCNAGTGEHYPAAQIDAALAASLAITRGLGLPPDAVCTHGGRPGESWAPDRKIDPAMAAAVEGAWQPAAVTGSGTWSLADLRAELARRSSTPPEVSDMSRQLVRSGSPDGAVWGNAWIAWGGGKYWLSTNEAIAVAVADFGYDPLPVEPAWMAAAGPVIGPNPTLDPWGIWSG